MYNICSIIGGLWVFLIFVTLLIFYGANRVRISPLALLISVVAIIILIGVPVILLILII